MIWSIPIGEFLGPYTLPCEHTILKQGADKQGLRDVRSSTCCFLPLVASWFHRRPVGLKDHIHLTKCKHAKFMLMTLDCNSRCKNTSSLNIWSQFFWFLKLVEGNTGFMEYDSSHLEMDQMTILPTTDYFFANGEQHKEFTSCCLLYGQMPWHIWWGESQ